MWIRIASLLSLALLVSLPAPADEYGLAELEVLLQAREFFQLRDRLQELDATSDPPPRLLYFQAAVQQAFNQPDESNHTVRPLLTQRKLELPIKSRLLHLQTTNHLRLHRYQAALESARLFLRIDSAQVDAFQLDDIKSKLPLLAELASVPPQETLIDGFSRLTLDNSARVPLEINGGKRRFSLDTGANFSVVMHSEAKALGLEIRPVGLVVSTSTSRKVQADVAIADEVRIGAVLYRHVVFLVFPDDLLTFPGGHTIPGLIGFPLVEAMGEVRYRRDGVIEIPNRPPKRRDENLALDDLDPLTTVRYAKDDLICRLDTGADKTVFYEPFFQRHRDRIEKAGEAVAVRTGGVGGIQEIPAFRLNKIVMTVARSGITLRDVDVYTQPIRAPEDNYLFCNVGLDSLKRYRAYVINFKDMALVLE